MLKKRFINSVSDSVGIRKLYEEYNEILRYEMNVLKCKPSELRHLIGRIGELYCAMHKRMDTWLKKRISTALMISVTTERLLIGNARSKPLPLLYSFQSYYFSEPETVSSDLSFPFSKTLFGRNLSLSVSVSICHGAF